MSQGPETAKKCYSPPSLEVLDASAAKAKLKSKGDPKDPNTQKMLSLTEVQLKKREAKSRSQDTT